MKEKSMHPLIDKEKQKLAKRYRKDNRIVSIISYIVTALLIFILLYFNGSKNLVAFLSNFTEARFIIILFYFAVFYFFYSLVTYPLAYIDGYSIEHKYAFSKQNFKDWFGDWLKSLFVGFVLGAIIFETIYLITYWSPHVWWLGLGLIMIIFSVIISNLYPVLILPLFYKKSPIEDENLKERISDMCNQTNIDIKGIYSINLSSKSTKANAAVVGFGNTKSILLGDTLIANYTEDESISALAHEITHFREHHIWWLIVWQSLITLVMFYVFHLIYPYIYGLVEFEKISDIAAFPLFAAIFGVLSFIFRPLTSSISRYYERRADRGALKLTNDPSSFISLIAKFCNKQLAIAYPHPLIEWYSYSHPSPGKRIKFAENW
jgi:STE24 endopeptidase